MLLSPICEVSYSKEYKDSLAVYQSLSPEEKLLVSPRGRFVDSPIILDRVVQKIHGKQVAFVEVNKYNGSDTAGFVLIAINAKYRGQGIADELVKLSIQNCRLRGMKKLIWRCDKSNSASSKVAIRNGFALQSSTKDSVTYSLDLTPKGSIEDFNKELCHYDYGFMIDGIRVHDFTPDNYYKYKLVSTKTFAKLKLGVCWDFTKYEAAYFDKYFPGVKYKTYYMDAMFNSNRTTHTWFAFEKDRKIHIFEAAWNTYQGIHAYPTETKMLNDYRDKLLDFWRKRDGIEYEKYIIVSYTPPPDEKCPLTGDEFIGWVAQHSTIIQSHNYNLEAWKKLKSP